MAPSQAHPSIDADIPFDVVRSHVQVDYRCHYAEVLRLHPSPPVAIAELCLFRFWLACRVHRHAAAPDGIDADTGGARLRPPRGWPLPLQAGGHDIEFELGSRIEQLVESRFDLYDRFFTLGRNADDPLGLDAASLALSYQLFVQTPPAILARLQVQTQQLFAALSHACAA